MPCRRYWVWLGVILEERGVRGIDRPNAAMYVCVAIRWGARVLENLHDFLLNREPGR